MISIIQPPVKKDTNCSLGPMVPVMGHGQALDVSLWLCIVLRLWVVLSCEFGGPTNMTSGVTPWQSPQWQGKVFLSCRCWISPFPWCRRKGPFRLVRTRGDVSSCWALPQELLKAKSKMQMKGPIFKIAFHGSSKVWCHFSLHPQKLSQ